MKIALVHSFYRSGSPSGENIAVEGQARALEEAGHEVLLISRRSDDFAGDAFYSLQSGLTVATGVGPSPLPSIEKFDPDVVHVHNLFHNWGTTWLSQVQAPVVATIHNFRPVCSAGTLLRDGKFCELCPTSGSHHAVKHGCYRESSIRTLPLAIASRKGRVSPLFERADSLVFLSERTRKMYDSFGLGFAQKSHVVPNFTDSPSSVVRTLRSVTSLSWVYVGRLSKEKGILELLRNWPPELSLRVVGSGPEERACRLAAEGKRVEFLGQQDRKAVDLVLGEARGLVFPSLCFESAASLSYLEAIARGLPVLALTGNAVADDVLDGGTGVVVSSLPDFARGIDAIEADHSGFSTRAEKRFAEQFSKDVWIERIEGVYREAVAGAKSDGGA